VRNAPIEFGGEMPGKRKKGLFERLKETARMALGQDDADDYECTRG
jgi:hypothetical protein